MEITSTEKDAKVNQLATLPGNGSANDISIDKDGNIYVTELTQGKVFRLKPDGAFKEIGSNLAGGPNGLDVDPDNKFLYVNMANAGQIVRYPLPIGDTLPAGETFAGGVPTPDECAFDAWGNLWVAHFGGAAVEIFDTNTKRALGRVATGQRPTSNLAFGGANFDEIFTSSGVDGSAKIVRLPVGVVGFRGHQGTQYKVLRTLDNKVLDTPY